MEKRPNPEGSTTRDVIREKIPFLQLAACPGPGGDLMNRLDLQNVMKPIHGWDSCVQGKPSYRLQVSGQFMHGNVLLALPEEMHSVTPLLENCATLLGLLPL